MASLISIVFAGLMSAFIYGYRFYARPGRVYEQLGGPASVGSLGSTGIER